MHFIRKKNIALLKEALKNELLIVPIMSSQESHHTENTISFLYIYDINNGNELVVNQSHNDLPSMDLHKLRNI